MIEGLGEEVSLAVGHLDECSRGDGAIHLKQLILKHPALIIAKPLDGLRMDGNAWGRHWWGYSNKPGDVFQIPGSVLFCLIAQINKQISQIRKSAKSACTSVQSSKLGQHHTPALLDKLKRQP